MYISRVFSFNWGWSPKQPWHTISVIILGVVTASIAYVFYSNSTNELKAAIHIDGVVSDSIIKDGLHVPVIDFKNKHGESITFLSSMSSTPQKYFKGDKVTVLYFPKSTKKPRINNWFSNWAVATFFTVFSIFSFIMSGVIWLVRGNGTGN